ALQRSAGMRNQAAEILGVHRNTLRNRMRVLKITARRGS
ncbi:MAG: helix-turn-helix domain-containing protein, partial [Deltaproteobacteria bacterium]|nr:helix-turn-helix domain-containing protein [Deltaproteobacteria bacterium]